jgi:hypothetical protein
MGIAELKRETGMVAPERSEGEHGEPSWSVTGMAKRSEVSAVRCKS